MKSVYLCLLLLFHEVIAGYTTANTCETKCAVSYQVESNEQYSKAFSDFDSLLMSLPNQITTLTFTTRCKVAELKQNALQRFTKLRKLSLQLCGMNTNIHGSVFCGLGNLEELTLDFVPDTFWQVYVTIEPSTFEPVRQLKILKLLPHTKSGYDVRQRIDITEILKTLPHLQHLTLNTYTHKNAIIIDGGIKLPSIQSMDLSDNDWGMMPCLPALTNLRHLNLANNKISSIRFWPDCLQSQNITIQYQNNPILIIESQDLDAYHNVGFLSLDFSETYLTQVNVSAFESFRRTNGTITELIIGRGLKHMAYEDNFFTNLFTSLQRVTIHNLTLFGMDIKLTPGDFSALSITSLKHLSMTTSNINTIPQRAFTKLTSLEYLDLTNCHITFIDYDAFSYLEHLRTVILTGNQPHGDSFQNVFTSLRKLPSLRTLKMNRMGKWYRDPGYTHTVHAIQNNLHSLDLSDNSNMCIILTVKNLRVLRLNNVTAPTDPSPYICRFSLRIKKIRTLQSLEIRNCPLCIKTLDWWNNTEAMPDLTTLDASHNYKIAVDSEPLRKVHMPNLKILKLSNNRLFDLNDGTFSKLPKLEVIDLSSNSIGNIPKGVFKQLDNLKELILDHNVISNIDASNFKGHMQMEMISLQGNKFECNCDLREFRDWLQSRRQISMKENLDNCSYPTSLKNVSISDFQLPWTDCDGHIYMIIGLSTLGLLLLITPILVLSHYRLDLKYWYYFKYKYNNCPTNESFSYDAMVCYNVEDVGWVKDQLRPQLEDGNDYRFKLCIHHRDFKAGEWIKDNIINSMNHSRSLIFVMTKTYMNSEWGDFELEMALMRLLEVKRQFIVMIMLEKIPKKLLKRKLKCFVNHMTYVELPDSQGKGNREKEKFWKKLVLALMSHRQMTVVDDSTPLLKVDV